jgi:diguanylate cyclase (GGDEF)-like protein
MAEKNGAFEAGQNGAQAAVPPLLEPLLAVHSAPSQGWLVDGAATAAERGLGALYSLVFLLDSSGALAGERPASSERMRAVAKLNQLLETNVSSLKFDPQQVPAALAALEEGRAVAVPELREALLLPQDEKKLRSVQKQLGVAEVWLAPLHWSGESTGLLVLFMPDKAAAPLSHAELLGQHLAVALSKLRAQEAGRKRGELDAVRWISDEQRFDEQLQNEVRRALRHKRPLSILLIRLDNYHDLRARYGRFLAERLLRQVAGVLEDTMRDTDFLGAFKDNGFAAILIEADGEAARRAKERLSRGLSDVTLPHAQLPDLRLDLTCATATVPDDGETPQDLAASAEGRLEPPEAPQEEVA